MDTAWINEENLSEAVQLLRNGEVVAFPTETVYGLGADATQDRAVKKIFAAKGRPIDNPLIVHVASVEQARQYVKEIPQKALRIMECFWPGPCTIILKKKEGLAETVTAGLSSVGIRIPDHPIALYLIEASGLPLAAPSANSSGKPSPTSAQHVKQDLDGKIGGIVNGGDTGVGLESTVLDLTTPEKPVILRPGGISKEQLEEIIGPVSWDDHLLKENELPKSPGMKYTHYSPAEPVWIVETKWEEAIQKMEAAGEKVGLLASEETIKQWQSRAAAHFSLGKRADSISASHLLYRGLRSFEETEATVILAEAYPKEEIGTAYMNRLEKAAGSKRIK